MSHPSASSAIPRPLWRVAGGFALAHVVLLFAGISQQAPSSMSDGPSGIERAYADGNMTRMFAGGLIEVLGFLCLVVAMVFLARAVGRRTEVGRWAAQTGLMFGVCYIAATFATGWPAGAAAVYGAQHGLDVETAFAINNIRNFAYFLSLALLGAHTLSIAVAAFSDRLATRWLGWGGVVTGLVLLADPPLAAIGQQDWSTLVWVVWWVGVGILLIRQGGEEADALEESSRTLPEPSPMRHA